MKKLYLALVVGMMAGMAVGEEANSGYAAVWQNIDHDHYIAGPEITPANLKGRVVLVDRWAFWCGPCCRAMPHNEELYQKYRRRGLIVLGAASDTSFRIEETRKVLAEAKTTFPVYRVGEIANPPTSRGIPFLYIVNAEGKVVYQQLGAGGNRLEEEIVKALDSAKNLVHDMLKEAVKENLRSRPGLALLKAQEFIKRYPAEKKTMNKAMQALAGSTNRKLAELEAKLLEFQEKPPVNELAKKRRATQIKDLAAKARKLDAEYLAKDFLSLEK